jgi:hypothetical protein
VNSLEDRLRDAYRTAAGTVSPDRLRNPRPHWPDPREYGPHRRQGGLRLALTPLAAAAAIVVVVIGSVVVAGAWPRILGVSQGSGQPAAPTPRYMLVIPSVDLAAHARLLYPPLQVQVAGTGQVTGTLRAPRSGTHWAAAAASADNRSFVLAAEWNSAPGHHDYTWLYRLTLTADGQVADLAPLDVARLPATILPGGLAESADGQRVAYMSLQIPETGHPTATIGVIDTATGQVRRWTISEFARPQSVSLSADGSLLAVSAQADPFPAVWVVPTDAAPGPVEQRGRPAVRLPQAAAHGIALIASVISADGGTLFVQTFRTVDFHVTTTLAAYGVATGRLLRTVRTLDAEDGFMSADPDVDHMVIWGLLSATPPVVIDLATGAMRTVRVRLPAYVYASDVAW